MTNIRICVNTLSFPPSHKGGVESVLFNLAKGFRILGYAKKITYFCYQNIGKLLKEITPESEIVIIKDMINEKHARISAQLVQTLKFHRLYEKYNFDVILFASSEVGLFKYKVPTLIIPHDIQNVSRPEMNKNKIMFYLHYFSYKISFKNMDRIIAISDVDKQEIEKYYPFAKNKIIKIYDPIDMAEKEIKHVENKQEYILAVNIQYEHKNIDTLIRAFSLFSKNHPRYKLYLAGAKNEYTNKLEELVKQLKLIEKVIFLGFIDKKQLVDYWSKAKLYINPSIFEGFGMTSVESIFYGAPTLLSDLAINREVTQGLCAYYDDIKNPKALAAAMENSINEPYDKEVYLNKTKMLLQKYNLKEISKQYLDVLVKSAKNK